MGWETRGGRRVYCRKERYRGADGKSHVRSVYFGSGERAEAAAREDVERRRARLTDALLALNAAPVQVAPAPQVEPPRPSLSPSSVPAPRPLSVPTRPLRGVAAWRSMGRTPRPLDTSWPRRR